MEVDQFDVKVGNDSEEGLPRDPQQLDYGNRFQWCPALIQRIRECLFVAVQ